MSLNSTKNDKCYLKAIEQDNKQQFEYNIYPIKYKNNSKCIVKSGIVGENGASVVGDVRSSKLTNLESDLLGITRKNSHCASQKYRKGEQYHVKKTHQCEFTEREKYPYVSMKPLYQGNLNKEYENINKKYQAPKVAPNAFCCIL